MSQCFDVELIMCLLSTKHLFRNVLVVAKRPTTKTPMVSKQTKSCIYITKCIQNLHDCICNDPGFEAAAIALTYEV